MRRIAGIAMFSVLAALTFMSPPTTSAQTATAVHRVIFGAVGDLTFDPAGGGGGASRDVNVPNSLVILPGERVDFVNRSGGQHQVAVFGPNLRNNGTAAATNFEDLTISRRGPSAWGNFIVPPDGAIPTVDDPVTDIDERRVRDGLLSLGPSPVGVTTADREQGKIDHSFTFSAPGSYLVICNFRPHVLGFGQATFVLVKGPVPPPPPAAQAAPAKAAPAPAKTGQAGLAGDSSGPAAAIVLLAMTGAVLVLGGRALTGRARTR